MSERLTSVARFMAGTYLFLCNPVDITIPTMMAILIMLRMMRMMYAGM